MTIYQCRLEMKMSQAELAGKAGIAQANLSNIEKGKRDLTVSTLLRIASALGVKPSQLIDPPQDRNPPALTRDKIEKLARFILAPHPGGTKELKELAQLFRVLIPETNARASAKKTSLAWANLRRRLSAAEIKGVMARVEDARQRSDAKKTD